jgi:hypothetical protein
MAINERPRIVLIVAAVCVVGAWFGIMLLLNYIQVERNLILTMAPASSVVLAVVFLYLGKNRHPVGNGPPMLELSDDIISTRVTEQARMPVDISERKEEAAIVVEEPVTHSPFQSTIMAEVPQNTAVTATEIPESVHKIMDAIEKRTELRCLMIAAPSHGVLQDRLNNWLGGKYGRLVSTSMAANEKGFYLAVFYEPFPMQT